MGLGVGQGQRQGLELGLGGQGQGLILCIGTKTSNLISCLKMPGPTTKKIHLLYKYQSVNGV